MMLRRLKEDVEKNLAPKEETIIEVELTNIQKKYYRAILEKNFTFLSKSGGGGGGGGGSNVPNLLNTMMELRKCCNHPYLINGTHTYIHTHTHTLAHSYTHSRTHTALTHDVLSRVGVGAEEKIMEEFRESHPADLLDFHLQAMIQAAGKLVLIDKLLPKLKAGGHRVLIFSQMVRCLDILEDYLIQKRYPYERIDGRVRGNLRQAAIDRFSRPDSDRFVFLLCTRAGGLGINLTAADTCIIFDSDWNPQNDLQAQARCHRIGQSKAVKIYRLITRNSYEREMFDKASLKLGLDKAVLQSMSGRENAANGVQQLSKKEIEDLLRKGAYGALMDEEDEGSKFCEEDIDQILQRRTQTITIESEGKGSTFAKASFVASGNRTDISLEDPDFWQKWAKKAELDLDVIHGRNTLVIDTPRVRKQTRHYSSIKEDEMMEYSELESDSEDRPVQKTRRPQDRAQGYPRSECFRVEKNLLVYGWGRWRDILSHGRFKRPLHERDVEMICRALLAYCLLHYRGDENIKSFVWDLITPTEDGQSKTLTNHSGLSAPVPRGRKGKKGKVLTTQTNVPQADWLVECNPDVLLQEDSYKRHLKHHCNKVLLRVRMLYYLRQEVIGDLADRILEGADSSELDIWIPQPLHAEVPTDWWDVEADKCLLIGVFKHGYEKYNSMRADPALCFLERVGMPDAKAIAAEQRGADMVADGEDEDPEYKPLRMPFKDDLDDFTNSPLDDKEEVMEVERVEVPKASENGGKAGKLYWPAASALTARLRRLITAYQRCHKRQEALVKPDRRRRRWHRDEHLLTMATEGGAYSLEPSSMAAAAYLAEGASFAPFLHDGAPLLADGAAFSRERRQRWTRREEADFYRVISTFGVVYDVQRQCFDWAQFRAFARLDKKTDESLEKYYYAFRFWCRLWSLTSSRFPAELADPALIIDPITEERASRTLYRIELLRRIREQVLPHPQLEERLRLCQPGPDLPAWWEAGKHDRDLLQGAAKHGVSRTDYHIQNDPELGFLQAQRKFLQSRGPDPTPTSNPLATVDLIKDEDLKDEMKDDTAEKVDTEDVKEEKPEAVSPEQEVKTEEEEKNLKEEKMEKEDGAEVKMEESRGVPQTAEEEKVAESEDTPALTVPFSEDASAEEPENLTESCKPNTEEEEEEEEKMDEDDKSEKSSQAEVGVSSDRKNFDEESNASMSTARDETRDYFGLDDGEPSVSQAFGERAAFSFWPKDRVMINRMDNICEAIIKGKWPSNRRQYIDLPGLLPGYVAMTTDSPLPRRSMGEFSVMNQSSYSGSDDITMSPQINKDEALSLSVPRQRRRRRRKVEIEAERAAKRRNLMEMVAQLRESHAAEGQARTMDLTKTLHGLAPSSSASSSSSVFPGAVASPMELLQAAGASRANGAVLEAEIPTRRRRGRRKNVEGLELLFMGNKGSQLNKDDSNGTKGFADGTHVPARTPRHIPAPAQKEDGEDGASTKDLQEWLRQHPTYTMDVPGYIPKSEELLLSQLGKPKQKRHRCRNPNKIDINTLTGEERVPVVNKRNGRKARTSLALSLSRSLAHSLCQCSAWFSCVTRVVMLQMGGAMAPPMKDLPRWLAENPEFAIAPDWTDIVKQSGFLPESMFDRLLTGPVVREEGVRRRGRRPKSEIAKAAAAQASLSAASAASTSGVNPFLLNGLFGGMDLSSLQNLQNLQNLQLLMGLSPSLAAGAADNKNAATMLPLMLPAMGALPNVFGLGGLFGGNVAAAAAAAANLTPNASATASSESEETKKDGEPKEESEDKKEEVEKPVEAETSDVN
ncbi:chromodomain-helicase-DNA-binding protein 7, partial [Clarias magur]